MSPCTAHSQPFAPVDSCADCNAFATCRITSSPSASIAGPPRTVPPASTLACTPGSQPCTSGTGDPLTPTTSTSSPDMRAVPPESGSSAGWTRTAKAASAGDVPAAPNRSTVAWVNADA